MLIIGAEFRNGRGKVMKGGQQQRSTGIRRWHRGFSRRQGSCRCAAGVIWPATCSRHSAAAFLGQIRLSSTGRWVGRWRSATAKVPARQLGFFVCRSIGSQPHQQPKAMWSLRVAREPGLASSFSQALCGLSQQQLEVHMGRGRHIIVGEKQAAAGKDDRAALQQRLGVGSRLAAK